MKVFDKIKAAKGSNAKKEIAEKEFSTVEHEFMEVCFNNVVLGISGAGIAKAIGYDESKFGKTEDLGEFVEKLIETNDTDRFVKVSGRMKIKDMVEELKTCSGNEQIERFKELLNFFDLDAVPWVIRAIQGNMRMGLNLSSYNKVRKAQGMTEITGFGVQLCGKLEVSRENFAELSYPRIAEFKYDGERCIITVKNGFVSLQSRAGKNINQHYPEVIKELEEKFKDVDDMKLDSEIISSSFVKLSTRMHRKAENITETDDSLKAIIFDILSRGGTDMRTVDQLSRRTNLELIQKEFDLDLSYTKIVKDVDELLDFYKSARKIDQEGVVTKNLDGKWVEGSRDDWTKMVPRETLDLKIVEGYFGNGKNSKVISGVIVESNDGTIRTKAASGFTDENRAILTKLHEDDELIGKIAEIDYREKCPAKDGVSALRFPVFRRLRDDKLVAD